MITAQELYCELETQPILLPNGNRLTVSSTYKIHSPCKNEFLITGKKIKCNYT